MKGEGLAGIGKAGGRGGEVGGFCCREFPELVSLLAPVKVHHLGAVRPSPSLLLPLTRLCLLQSGAQHPPGLSQVPLGAPPSPTLPRGTASPQVFTIVFFAHISSASLFLRILHNSWSTTGIASDFSALSQFSVCLICHCWDWWEGG